MSEIVIVGGGASVNIGIKKGLWDKVKGMDIMTCNNAILHLPYAPKYAIWLDATEKDPTVTEKILNTECIRVTQQLHDQRDDDKVIRFEVCRNPDNLVNGLKHNPPVLYAGKRMFTGVFGITLSLYMGYETIYLLGFDWGGYVKSKKDNVEWWGATKDFKGTDINIYKKGDKAREDVAEHHDCFKGMANIINVSPKSLVPSFPKISYDEFFRRIDNNVACCHDKQKGVVYGTV